MSEGRDDSNESNQNCFHEVPFTCQLVFFQLNSFEFVICCN